MSDSVQAWAELRLVHALVTSAVARALEAEGVGPAEAFALYRLASGPAGGMRMGELADRLAMVQSAITRVIDRLEERGWVVREQPRDNRRTVYASLTPLGQSVFERIRPLLEATVNEHLAAPLAADQLAEFRGMLGRILERGGAIDRTADGRLPRSAG